MTINLPTFVGVGTKDDCLNRILRPSMVSILAVSILSSLYTGLRYALVQFADLVKVGLVYTATSANSPQLLPPSAYSQLSPARLMTIWYLTITH